MARLSFKLFSLFPGAMVGLPPSKIFFLDLFGFCALNLSDPLCRFSQARLLPFMVASPTVYISEFCFVIWLLLHMSLAG